MVLESQYEQNLAALFMKQFDFVCLFSVCFIQNTKSAHFVSEDCNRQVIFSVIYSRNCEFICELSKHHEIMDYDDNAAITATGADSLWRSVWVPAPAHMGFIPESGLTCFFSSAAKRY